MRVSHIIERLKEDTEYQEFFKRAMKKFGISSPAELSGEEKKDFFNYVDKNYSAKTESFFGELEEDYFPRHSQDSPDLKKVKAQLSNWFQYFKINLSKIKPGQLDILADLIEDYADAYARDAMESGDYSAE